MRSFIPGRKNALYGERLQLDIMNMIFDTCENIATNAKMGNDLDSLKLTAIGVLGISFQISAEELEKISEAQLAEKLYDEAYANYNRKNENIAEKAFPILENILRDKEQVFKDIQVPFTDGKKQIMAHVNLEKAVETEGQEVILAMEKISILNIIDQAWKEHLREMDDLKQSVQNAVYEQKDPLIIYKFEGFELFKQFIGKVNEDKVSFLVKSAIPVEQAKGVREARQQRSKQDYQESKEESRSSLAYSNDKDHRSPDKKQAPAKSAKVVGRNDRVTVQYPDGTFKKDVKFKTVEQDVKSNKCVLVEA